MVSSILVALSPQERDRPIEKYRSVYDKYKSILFDEQKKYNDSIADNKKSERDEVNWTTWKSITDVQQSLKVKLEQLGITEKTPKVNNPIDLLKLQDYVIASLYTILPPRRLIYADAQIITFVDYKKLSNESLENNVYLVVKNNKTKFFHYGKSSSKSATSEDVIVNIPSNLNRILNMWLVNNMHPFLLLNEQFDKLTSNALGKQISRIFKPTGKNISVVMLRKIFLSEKFADQKDKKNNLAEKMNHSIAVQQGAYVKDI
jgi:hypothetical protein